MFCNLLDKLAAAAVSQSGGVYMISSLVDTWTDKRVVEGSGLSGDYAIRPANTELQLAINEELRFIKFEKRVSLLDMAAYYFLLRAGEEAGILDEILEFLPSIRPALKLDKTYRALVPFFYKALDPVSVLEAEVKKATETANEIDFDEVFETGVNLDYVLKRKKDEAYSVEVALSSSEGFYSFSGSDFVINVNEPTISFSKGFTREQPEEELAKLLFQLYNKERFGSFIGLADAPRLSDAIFSCIR